MKNLNKLTLEEANKLECALIMLESEVRNIITAYENLSQDEELWEKARETFNSNAAWWREVYEMLYERTADPSERNWKE